MCQEEELRAWLALSFYVRGERRGWLRAVAAAGSAVAFLDTDAIALEAGGLRRCARAVLRAARSDRTVEATLAACRRAGVELASFACQTYPPRLRQIGDPPFVLYYRGPAPAETEPAVAVVGARRATRYGVATAHRIGRELAAAGVTVLSGLAYGIDGAAHRGALETGRSAAVVAGGVDRAYPRRHRELQERLAASAGVFAEHPPGCRPRPYHFPERNRLITGMAAAVVIVEAAERSGSLVSARLALEQGRELFAVPGNIDSPASRGTNALLRDGCAPLLEVGDVLDAIGVPRATIVAATTATQAPQGREQGAIVACLREGAGHVDDIAARTGMRSARVLELLTELELGSVVERAPAGHYVLVDGAGFPAT